MKQLIYIGLFLITLSQLNCALSSASNSSANNGSANTNNLNVDNNLMEKSSVNNSTKSDNRINYIGCWGGFKGGAVGISLDEVYDPKGKFRTFYKEVFRKEGAEESEYLLELNENPKFSSLDKYVLLRFKNNTNPNETKIVLIYGYKSLEDYLTSIKDASPSYYKYEKSTGEGEFTEVSCDEYKHKN